MSLPQTSDRFFIRILPLMILVSAVLLLPTACDRYEGNRHWQKRIKSFQMENKTLQKGAVVFLGDSHTEGFDLHRYFPGIKPVNRGISGDHTEGLLARLQTSVYDLQPSRLFVMIGINDIGAGDGSGTILTNYRLLLDSFREHIPRAEIYIQSVLPTTADWPNCPPQKIIFINKEIHRMVQERDYRWIELYTLFVTGDGFLNPAYTSDGLHLNTTGYELWAEQLHALGLN